MKLRNCLCSAWPTSDILDGRDSMSRDSNIFTRRIADTLARSSVSRILTEGKSESSESHQSSDTSSTPTTDRPNNSQSEPLKRRWEDGGPHVTIDVSHLNQDVRYPGWKPPLF